MGDHLPRLTYRVTVCGDPSVSASARTNCCGCASPPWGDGPIIDLTGAVPDYFGDADGRPWQWYQTRANWFGAG